MESIPAAQAAEKEFSLALTALAAEDTLAALSHLERALKLRDFSGWYSYLGFCISKERGQHRKGLELCRESLVAEPDNPDHFLNLGRVQLIMGNREEALQSLRAGVSRGSTPGLVRQLERLGTRRPPVFAALSRTNPLNKYLGILLGRLGLR